MAIIRILRVLEYIGEEEVVWEILRTGGVPANGERGNWNSLNPVLIKSGLVGYPDFNVDKPRDKDD